MASAHRSPLLQEIGNPTNRKLYSSANNLIDNQPGCSSYNDMPQNSLDMGEDFVMDNDIYESVVLHNKHNPPNNLKAHFSEEPSIINDDYPVKAVGQRAAVAVPKATSPKCQKPPEWEHSYSTNFVQNVASTLVGTAKRVKSKKRDRSKSKESKRRDSSESRLASLADFFRSPTGSRKSSLNSPRIGERKNSVTIKINDQDGLESSPENSIGGKSQQSSQHKSRISKSPLRVLNKMRTWGSRDALDDKTATVKVEYSVLENVISIPQLGRRDSSDQAGNAAGATVPKFLAANSREGIDFESLESELCNFDSEHSNDSSRSKSSLGPYHETPGARHKRSPIALEPDAKPIAAYRLDHGIEMNSFLHYKSRSNEYLRSCDGGDGGGVAQTSPGRLQDAGEHQSPRADYSPKRSLPASFPPDHASLCRSTPEDIDVASNSYAAEQFPRMGGDK